MKGTSPARYGIEVPRLSFIGQATREGSHGTGYYRGNRFGKAGICTAWGGWRRARGASSYGTPGAADGGGGRAGAVPHWDGSVRGSARVGTTLRGARSRSEAHGGE